MPRPVPATPEPCITEPMAVPMPVAPEPKAPEPTVPVSVPQPTESIYFKLRNKLKINMPSMPTSIATQAAIKVVPKLVPPKLAPPKLTMLKKVTAVSFARFAFRTVIYEAWLRKKEITTFYRNYSEMHTTYHFCCAFFLFAFRILIKFCPNVLRSKTSKLMKHKL